MGPRLLLPAMTSMKSISLPSGCGNSMVTDAVAVCIDIIAHPTAAKAAAGTEIITDTVAVCVYKIAHPTA